MKKLKKLVSAGLVLTMAVSLLAGCSGNSGSNNNSTAGSSGEKGRYVEQDYGYPVSTDDEYGYAYIQTMTQLEDGTIRTLINDSSELGFSIMDSTDGGKTWTASSMDLSAISELKPANDENTYGYMNTAAMDEEGNLAFVYTVNVSRQEGNMSINDSTSTYYLLSKDGQLKEIPVEIPGISKTEHYEYQYTEEIDTDDESEGADTAEAIEDEIPDETEDDGIIINEGEDGEPDYENYNGIQTFKLVDSNTLYVLDYNGSIYQVSISDGKVISTIEDFDWINDMYLCGDKLLIYNWEKVAEYDAATGKKTAEHEALAEIFQNSRGSVVIANYLKDDSIIYYVCSDGIFSYNLTDSTSEQIVDANMSSLISPNSNVDNMIIKDNGDILLRFSDYSGNESTETLLNYTYDAEAAKKPDKELTIYSLQDNYDIRTLAAMFQKSHPDIYVNVEYGVSYDDAITASDAIRTLNTEIMAGEGPDIIFLDGLPIDSYVEKGLLADISDITEPMISEGKLFENIANTYQTDDGKLYAIPTKFRVPVLIGKKSMLDQINSLSDFAAMAEQYVSEAKEGDAALVESWSALSLLGDMMPVNSASWFNEDGSLNKDNLKTYLQDIKTLFNAFCDSMSEDEKTDFEDTLSYYTSDDMGELDASWYGTSDPSWSVLYILAGQFQLAYGAMSSSDSLESISSAMRRDADITYKQLPGSLENVYIPSNVIGINSKSKDMETAKAFFSYMLSSDGQDSFDSYNGFSVNIDSFNKSMTDPNADQPGYDPNQSTGGWGTTDENGNEIMLDMYWPTEEQIADFKAMIGTLSTPSYSDNTILSTILNDCFGCIVGDDSIDDAVEQVVKDINIYLSE
ncbi:MAG: ABC transporter substrate-binding protein [Coprococcus sp.]